MLGHRSRPPKVQRRVDVSTRVGLDREYLAQLLVVGFALTQGLSTSPVGDALMLGAVVLPPDSTTVMRTSQVRARETARPSRRGCCARWSSSRAR